LAIGLLALAAVALATREIASQWVDFRRSGARLAPRWELVALSSLIVVTAYAVLVETWRRTVRAWDSDLPWIAAARIWFVSNLGRYLPGKVWQIGAMGLMAQRQGVSVVAATGSALVINVVNVLSGFGLVMVTAAELVDSPLTTAAFTALLGIGILLAPKLVPLTGRVASRVLRRRVEIPALPGRAIWTATAGCLAAWILYGVAFQVFVRAVLGSAPGPTSAYVAAFTGSYLAGYIVLFAPGGLGVREGSLIVALGRLGLAQAGAAGVISLTSRLWLTALELIPGLLFLLADAVRSRMRARPNSTTTP